MNISVAVIEEIVRNQTVLSERVASLETEVRIGVWLLAGIAAPIYGLLVTRWFKGR